MLRNKQQCSSTNNAAGAFKLLKLVKVKVKVKVKLKQSLYRSGLAQRVPGS
jgi:hypothetical protein